MKRVGLAGRETRIPSSFRAASTARRDRARTRDAARRILFDEPTSALDPELVARYSVVMASSRSDGMTMVVVTHEMGFARVSPIGSCSWTRGEIVETGPPKQLFEQPRTERLQRFLSQVLRGESSAGCAFYAALARTPRTN